MKKTAVALWVIALVCFGFSPLFAMELSTVQKAIGQTGAGWKAKVPDRLNPMRLGIRSRVQSLSGHSLQDVRLSKRGSISSHFDWRNVDGKNYVTPVRNQGQCGSCWAFSVVGALESLALIELDMPGTDLDLSEQTLLSCSIAGDCVKGGLLDTAAEYIQKSGLPKEQCYPYLAYNTECGLICKESFGFHSSYNIKNWVYISKGTAPDLNLLKSMLASLGPLSVEYLVYEDFYYYQSGIYSYTSGDFQGEHGVVLVGYDDREQYFIVKNSWGEDWGEDGYFRIAYSEVGSVVKFAWNTIGLMGIAAPENRIFPEITANGGRNVVVKNDTLIHIAVSLDPVNQPQADPVDWWIWRTGADGTFSYNVNSGLWEAGLHPIKLPVFRLQPYTIWNGTLPTAGEYGIHFAVDGNDDGIFDGKWQGDTVVYSVQPSDAE